MEVKSAAQLNALAAPPDSPFTFTAEVTMTNDEGQTATGTVTYRTSYDRDEPTAEPPSDPPPQPTLTRTAISAPPGDRIELEAGEVFDNAGTNPKFTKATFSDTAYYEAGSGLDDGRLVVRVKSADDLKALASPPDSPFTITVTVAMTNDEGRTATGQLKLTTSYIAEEE